MHSHFRIWSSSIWSREAIVESAAHFGSITQDSESPLPPPGSKFTFPRWRMPARMRNSRRWSFSEKPRSWKASRVELNSFRSSTPSISGFSP